MCSDFSLNNLTESVSTIAPPHASDGFKTITVSFLPHSFFFCCSDLFMRMLILKNKSVTNVFFSIWPPVAVNVHYFLVRAIIDGLGGAIIIVETLPIRKLSSSLNSLLASIIQRVDKY